MDREQAKDVYSEGLMVGRRIGEALAQKELGSLRARVAELEEYIKGCSSFIGGDGLLVVKVKRLVDRITELEGALRKYGRHEERCVFHYYYSPDPKYRCTCDWDEVRKALSTPPVSAPAETAPASETLDRIRNQQEPERGKWFARREAERAAEEGR